MTDFQCVIRAFLQLDGIQSYRDYLKPRRAVDISQVGVKAFKNGNDRRVGEVVRGLYANYFKRVAQRMYKAEWELLVKDFREDIIKAGGPVGLQTPLPKPSSAKEEIIKALRDEIWATKQQAAQNPIHANIIKQFQWEVTGKYHYEAELLYEGDEDLPIQDNTPILLKWFMSEVSGTMLVYDHANNKLIVETEKPLDAFQKTKPFQLFPNTEHLIAAVINKVEQLSASHSIADKLLHNKTHFENLSWQHNMHLDKLDESQKTVTKCCLQNEVTFIWGPPGTGKTHTLGRIITNLVLAGEKVLVSSISNVAVDGVAKQIVQTFKEKGPQTMAYLNGGKVLRYGYAVLEEVRSEKRLFPDRPSIQNLLEKLHLVQEQKKAFKHNREKLGELTARQKELQKAIKEITQAFIVNSSIVLTTATQSNLEPAFEEGSWDTVIIDEGGMMPIPYVLTLAARAKKRLIVAGDFRQLGPIALAVTPVAMKWLHKDAFSLISVDSFSQNHACLKMLKTQRRMHPDICELIRVPFYKGELVTDTKKEKLQATEMKPLRYSPIVWINEEGTVEMTQSKSRFNKETAAVSCEWAVALVRTYKEIKVGIITPYRGQVALCKKIINGDDKINESQRSRIKVGTIHAFQGDESDVIILDICDAMNRGVGRLYHGETGDRLINVAVSRAQGKLIVVGNLHVFLSGSGHTRIKKFAGFLQSKIIDVKKYHL